VKGAAQRPPQGRIFFGSWKWTMSEAKPARISQAAGHEIDLASSEVLAVSCKMTEATTFNHTVRDALLRDRARRRALRPVHRRDRLPAIPPPSTKPSAGFADFLARSRGWRPTIAVDLEEGDPATEQRPVDLRHRTAWSAYACRRRPRDRDGAARSPNNRSYRRASAGVTFA
jgi:hypothetical protein